MADFTDGSFAEKTATGYDIYLVHEDKTVDKLVLPNKLEIVRKTGRYNPGDILTYDATTNMYSGTDPTDRPIHGQTGYLMIDAGRAKVKE